MLHSSSSPSKHPQIRPALPVCASSTASAAVLSRQGGGCLLFYLSSCSPLSCVHCPWPHRGQRTLYILIGLPSDTQPVSTTGISDMSPQYTQWTFRVLFILVPPIPRRYGDFFRVCRYSASAIRAFHKESSCIIWHPRSYFMRMWLYLYHACLAAAEWARL